MLQKIRWFFLLGGITIVVIIAFQNSRSVELDLLFFKGEYPLTMLLLASSAASFVFGALTTGWMLRSRSKAAVAKANQASETQAQKDSETDKVSPANTSPLS